MFGELRLPTIPSLANRGNSSSGSSSLLLELESPLEVELTVSSVQDDVVSDDDVESESTEELSDCSLESESEELLDSFSIFMFKFPSLLN